MFGMGFTEILFIAVIAILFLGPDKLPDAMIQVAKLFKSISKTVNEAKSSFEEEIRIKELREEALSYRREIEKASSDIAGFKNAIPNPVAEIDDAVRSVTGDRMMDDDLMADIRAAEAAAQAADPASAPAADPDPQAEADKGDTEEAEDDPLAGLDDGGLDAALASDEADRAATTQSQSLLQADDTPTDTASSNETQADDTPADTPADDTLAQTHTTDQTDTQEPAAAHAHEADSQEIDADDPLAGLDDGGLDEALRPDPDPQRPAQFRHLTGEEA